MKDLGNAPSPVARDDFGTHLAELSTLIFKHHYLESPPNCKSIDEGDKCTLVGITIIDRVNKIPCVRPSQRWEVVALNSLDLDPFLFQLLCSPVDLTIN